MDKKMFCNQCQEAAKGTGCEIVGVCGKTASLSSHMDAFKYVLKGLGVIVNKAREEGLDVSVADLFIMDGLFKLITNANFDDEVFAKQIVEGITIRENLKHGINSSLNEEFTKWGAATLNEALKKGIETELRANLDVDIKSAREIVFNGLMGMAAYHSHAYKLGYSSKEIFGFTTKALEQLCDDSLALSDYVQLIDVTGKYSVDVMALLDEANSKVYGNKEITTVSVETRNNPGILISGHDLHDIKMLLEQTKGTGVDVYTHSEMLPAHYYPELKKYDNLVGNYGNAWWQQTKEFEQFNGPILFTTNCIVPPKADAVYNERVFTTANTGYPSWKHIEADENGQKDFTEIIELAKKCDAPVQIETGSVVGGFGHQQVIELADAVVDAVKSGAISKFVVMAGCDGRFKGRSYYTDFAKALPKSTVILTAGCAKFRYNKLDLGSIGAIPRVLDAGQCNDSYSLVVIALTLAKVFDCGVNELPIAYNIAWYEQKAITVLLALLHLGVQNIKVGPSLPAFISPNVAEFLIGKFNISTISTVEEDMVELLGE